MTFLLSLMFQLSEVQWFSTRAQYSIQLKYNDIIFEANVPHSSGTMVIHQDLMLQLLDVQ
jgi:hypothetical protein